MSTATYVIGDVRDTLAAMPDGSVDLVLTSPPFLALRSYLPADHPDKHREIGSEPTPAAFIDTLLALSAEWRRVLAPHGSICIELGDTYAGSGGAGGDYAEGGLRDGAPAFVGSARAQNRKPKTMSAKVLNGDPALATAQAPPDRLRTRRQLPGWPVDKSLCMIPELYRLALGYGVNPLTGQASPAGQWRVRNVVRWCRPNPPVGALGDKVRPATSDMVIACSARDRYFDLDAIREPSSPNTNARTAKGVDSRPNDGKTSPDGNRDSLAIQHHHATAPPLDHWWVDEFDQDAWLVSTEPYAGSHYATWPRKLLDRPIKAMCPLRVCTVCGEPSRRIAEPGATHPKASTPETSPNPAVRHRRRSARTIGWTDCGHDSWRNGVVLDPFAGSGTTLLVATGHGRDAIGIDFDARNADLATERIGGLFLTVQTLDEFAGKTVAVVGGI